MAKTDESDVHKSGLKVVVIILVAVLTSALCVVCAAVGIFGYTFYQNAEESTPTPIVSQLPTMETEECKVTGCSGQVCSDEDVITDCAWREEYACYKDATCERQSNGECGWTETESLKACLKATEFIFQP